MTNGLASSGGFRRLIAAAGTAALISLTTLPAQSQGVLQDWSQVRIPPPVELKNAKIEPRSTALLLLDFTTQTCTPARRPRCAASVPSLRTLLEGARAHGMFVVYSIATADSTAKDILPEIAPQPSDPVLPPLGPDKFINSDLEGQLKAKGIRTLIVTGTAAQTSVLHTAGEAALRGFKVVVPIDGMSSNDAFPELYTAWHLVNAARIMNEVTLTRADMVSY